MIEVREVVTDQEWQDYLGIRHVVFVQEQHVPEEIEVDAYEEEATHFIAFLEGKAAGTGRFRLKDSFVKFERVATLKEFRGKGIASALMDFMEKRAKMKHPQYLPFMHAQVDAISFYEKRGWEGVGEVFQEGGISHQWMVLIPKSLKGLRCLEDPKTPEVIKRYIIYQK
ncbi:MAG: GNAT family N-acetyltransferase [Chlamydiia bacterium]|nr:GNAT family N-acetyltransferase [Chlamydiia bacterium]